MDKGQPKRVFFAQGQTDNENTNFLNFRDKKTLFLWWSNKLLNKIIRIQYFDHHIFVKSWLLNAFLGQIQARPGLRVKLKHPCSKIFALKYTVLGEFRRWSHIKKPICLWLVLMNVNAKIQGQKDIQRQKDKYRDKDILYHRMVSACNSSI